MNIAIIVFLVLAAFFVGFWFGYQECFATEISPVYNESIERKKEGDVI